MIVCNGRVLHALGAALALAACRADNAEAPRAGSAALAVKVETQAVSTQALDRELVAVGSLRADESVTVRPEIAGRIARIGFTEGEPVAEGQLLFALDDSVYRAELDQARASLTLAQRNFDRATELFARKLIAQAERDQAAATLDLARATRALAQARLEKMHIVAPFAGIAGLRLVSPGEYVGAGQDLVNLDSMHQLKVDFRVDEAALPLLRVGQSLEIEVDAYPVERFKGSVYAVAPRVADATRSIGVRARLPNPDGRLRPGQFARVRLIVERKADAVVIPEQAIFPRGERQFVYVVDAGTARLREVRVGQRIPGAAEILAGLAAGEILVVAGLQRIGDGAAVRSQ